MSLCLCVIVADIRRLLAHTSQVPFLKHCLYVGWNNCFNNAFFFFFHEYIYPYLYCVLYSTLAMFANFILQV